MLKTETLNWPSVSSNEKSFGNCHNALRSAVIIIITTVFNYLLFIFLTKEPLGVRIPQNKGYQYVVELNWRHLLIVLLDMIDTVEPPLWDTSIQGTQNLVPEECSCNLCICFCINFYWREISIKEKGHFSRSQNSWFLSYLFFRVKSTNNTILVFSRKINWLANNTWELTYLFFKEDVKSQCKSQNQKNKHNHNLEYSLRHFNIHWDVSAKQAISSEKQHHVGVAQEDCNNSNIPKY